MANTQTRQSNESRMITNIDSTKTNEDNYRTALLGVKVCLAIGTVAAITWSIADYHTVQPLSDYISNTVGSFALGTIAIPTAIAGFAYITSRD